MIKNNYREIIRDDYDRKKQLNPRYSLNAYSRDLGIRPSHLSEMLRGKKGLSAVTARQIAAKIGLSKAEREDFVQQVVVQDGRSQTARESARKKLVAKYTGVDKELDDEVFSYVRDWIHFGLMEFVRISGRSFSLTTASRYFKVSSATIKDAFERLSRLKLIEFRGYWKSTDEVVHAPRGVPSQAKRFHHQSLMQLAQRAYLDQDFGERDYMSQIIAIDKSKMDQYKALIKQFHLQVNELSSSRSHHPEEVFCMNTQFFSLKGGGQDHE